jgi:hypothetical protein
MTRRSLQFRSPRIDRSSIYFDRASRSTTLITASMSLPVRIVENTGTTMRAVGKDELWLHKWICERPSRLKLGALAIKNSEVNHYKNKGGRLDILAYRGDLDTYYEIEVMLGECDADHGFRTLDYWARERLKKPDSKHVAVLVAEELSGRYKTLIETLPRFLPFIAIEINVLMLDHGDGLATVETTIVAQPDDLIIESGDEASPAIAGIEAATAISDVMPRDRDWWENNSSAAFMNTVDALAKLSSDEDGQSRVDYSARSYISLKKGRRCWLPMWPRKDGAYVYIPGGEGGSADAPSDFFNSVQARLNEAAMESPSWTYKYNAGANPISFAIPLDKVGHSVVRAIIKDANQLA